jgi:hypothetical protein
VIDEFKRLTNRRTSSAGVKSVHSGALMRPIGRSAVPEVIYQVSIEAELIEAVGVTRAGSWRY